MQEPLTDLLVGAGAAPEPDDEAYRQVRERVQSLITAARTLSDTCADLADALRPVPGHLPDDPLLAAFGRLRAERTAALLDEAASAARGTLGLLHSAYGALDRQARPGLPAPRSGATTWPDAFVEVPTQGFTLDEEAGTAVGLRSPWVPARAVHPHDATVPPGIPAVETERGPAAEDEVAEDEVAEDEVAEDEVAEDEAAEDEAAEDEAARSADAEPIAGAAEDTASVGPAEVGAAVDRPESVPEDADRPEELDGLRAGTATAEEDDATEDDATEDTEHGPEDVDGEGLRGWATTGLGIPAANWSRSQTQRQSQTRSHRAPDDDAPEHPGPEHTAPEHTAPEHPSPEHVDRVLSENATPGPAASEGETAGGRAAETGDGLEGADGMSVEDTDVDHPALLASAALAGWMVVDPDDADAQARPIQLADTGSRAHAVAAATARVTVPIDTDPRTPVGEVFSDRPPTADAGSPFGPALPAPDGDPFGLATDHLGPPTPTPAGVGGLDGDRFTGTPTGPVPLDGDRFGTATPDDRFGVDVDRFGTDDTAGWHGDTVSAEPRSLSLVPPPPDGPETATPTWGDDQMPIPADPWAAEPAPSPWPDDDPMGGSDLSGAAMFARVERPVWTAEPVPGSSVAGDGVAVFPISAANTATPVPPSVPLDEPVAAVISRQVEAARRHLQAALVVANGPSAPSRLGALLTAIEQVLTAVTDLARETRGVLDQGLADRTFPGEARFLCSPPWDGTQLVGRDAYGDDVASPAGLAKLLRALGYEAHSVTASSGAAGVQIRDERYAMQVALVEPAGGGRQRWSGALEWVDGTGASRTWAETIGPVELEDEELARRVDELLRRSVGT